MKTIAAISFVLLWTCALHAGTMYVTAESGLYLREKPDKDAKALILVPFRGRVEYLRTATQEVTVGGVKGRWISAKFGQFQGFCFDAFLKTYFPLKQNEVAGIFKTADDGRYMPSTLEFRPDGSFSMSANYCHGFVPVTGTWNLMDDPDGRGHFIKPTILTLDSQRKPLPDFRPVLRVESLDEFILFPVSGNPVACDFRDFESFRRAK